MKIIKFLFKLALLVMAFGIFASLYLNNKKDEYITFDSSDDIDLY